MAGIEIQILGYVCVSKDDPDDVTVCENVDDLIVTPGLEFLPIIDQSRYDNPVYQDLKRDPCKEKKETSYLTMSKNSMPRRTMPSPKSPRQEDGVESKESHYQHPVRLFFSKYPNRDPTQTPHRPLRVRTNRRVLRELVGQKIPHGARQIGFNLRVWKDNTMVVAFDRSHDGQFIEFGINVENYVTNRDPNKKRYTVHSIHTFKDPTYPLHYVYSAEVDAFFLGKQKNGLGNLLTPVEIKCVHPNDIGLRKKSYELQANLGLITNVVLAHYSLEGRFVVNHGKEIIKGNFATVKKFEKLCQDPQTQGKFPDYHEKCMSLFSKSLIACTKDEEVVQNASEVSPALLKLTVRKSANGKIKKIEISKRIDE